MDNITSINHETNTAKTVSNLSDTDLTMVNALAIQLIHEINSKGLYNSVNYKWEAFCNSVIELKNHIKNNVSAWFAPKIDKPVIIDYKIDYEKFYLEFNKAYLFRNIYKSIVSLLIIKKHLIKDNYDLTSLNIVDVGCGAGTFPLAFRKVFNHNANCTLIDISSKQLSLSRILLQNNCRFLNIDFHSFNDFPKKHLLTASYFLCEQTYDERKLFFKDVFKNGDCKGIIIIDYPRVVYEASEAFSDHERKLIWEPLARVSDDIAQHLDMSEKDMVICGIVVFKEKIRKRNTSVVEQYFDIWKNYRTDSLKEIFHNDATYEIINKNTIFTGLDNIKNYWNRNQSRQERIRLDYENIKIDRSKIKTLFKAWFYDNEESENQIVSGWIEFKFKDHKILSLTENYTKWVSQNPKHQSLR